MKQVFLIVVTFFLGMFVIACENGAQSVVGFSGDDLYLYIDGTPYSIGMDIEAVIADLGDGFDYAEAISCDYDGLDKTFQYDNAVFYTFPLNGGDIVSEIYSDSPVASTSKGVRVGTTKEEVLAAYGDDCEDTGWQLIYATDGGGALCFDMENGIVAAFYVTTRPF